MNPNEVIEIFRTNIDNAHDAHLLVTKLSALFPHARFNIDLLDIDKVLRMQGPADLKYNVTTTARDLGFDCVELI